MENDPRFPIGKFDRNTASDAGLRADSIRTIGELPQLLTAAVEGLDETQLEAPYRDGGWTLRQTVHHVADSHTNGLIRFKLALTEDSPTIRPYLEARWAELADARLPVEVSLKLIEGIHERWSALLSSMTDAEFGRKLLHPESGEWTLGEMLAMYAWHSRHHTAHITTTRGRFGW